MPELSQQFDCPAPGAAQSLWQSASELQPMLHCWPEPVVPELEDEEVVVSVDVAVEVEVAVEVPRLDSVAVVPLEDDVVESVEADELELDSWVDPDPDPELAVAPRPPERLPVVPLEVEV